MNNRIRIMTHNVWNCDNNFPEWEQLGEDCSAKVRVKGHLRVYQETMPDIIGGQEFSALMTDLLKQGFEDRNSDYAVIWGRYTPIIYRTSKFELIDTAFGTYPETLEGFDGFFNDVKSKSWNIAVFRIKENGKCFVLGNTHLWWRRSPDDNDSLETSEPQLGSDEAREYQISILSDKVKQYQEKYGCPAVLVGDFNTDYRSKAIKYLFKNGFTHAHDIATEYADETIGYHDCYPSGYEKEYYDRPFDRAIDHILVSGELKGAVKRFERYSPQYYITISDHSPAYMDIEF